MASDFPLIVLVGPTASGKTSLAVNLAERFGGEIICADSRTVYQGMDIGTAKPTQEEQSQVPHWGLDLVKPSDRFTAADFKQYAYEKIAEIRDRGRIPFLVGGTGLYVDGVLFDYQFGADMDKIVRAMLEQMSVEELQKYCNQHSIELPDNHTNKRYLVRAIEQNEINHKRNREPVMDSVIVGITTDREVLRTRIAHRSEQIFDDGVVEEAIKLGKKYGWDTEAMTGNVYKLVRKYLDGELTMQEMQQKNVISDRRLAKRQLTWFRRNQFIVWKSLDEAEHYLSDILARKTTS